MSEITKESNHKESYEPEKESPQKKYAPNISPESPATAKQRALLQLAIKKDWLQPNPFAQDYPKWEKLTAGEADKILATIPPERLGILERELSEQNRKRFDGKGMARGIGHGIEEVVKQIGNSIDH